jgi:hypothetical protein
MIRSLLCHGGGFLGLSRYHDDEIAMGKRGNGLGAAEVSDLIQKLKMKEIPTISLKKRSFWRLPRSLTKQKKTVFVNELSL